MPFRDTALEASEAMQAEQKENPDVWLMAHKEGNSNMYIIKTRDADMANKMMACMNPQPEREAGVAEQPDEGAVREAIRDAQFHGTDIFTAIRQYLHKPAQEFLGGRDIKIIELAAPYRICIGQFYNSIFGIGQELILEQGDVYGLYVRSRRKKADIKDNKSDGKR